MRRDIPPRLFQQPAVDVSDKTALTPEDAALQWIDPRSRMAELSASLEHPAHVAADDPGVGQHLGRNRIYLLADNVLYESVQHLRRYPMHRPNLKALHLNTCVCSTQAAAESKERFAHAIESKDSESAETESMNFMEYTVMAMYSGIATLEVFTNETIGEKLDNDDRGKAEELTHEPLDKKLGRILPELLRVTKPKRTRWWPEFQAIRSARNSLTHGAPQMQDDEEKTAQAWSKMLGLQRGIPEVVIKAMNHYVMSQPPWWDGIVPNRKR